MTNPTAWHKTLATSTLPQPLVKETCAIASADDAFLAFMAAALRRTTPVVQTTMEAFDIALAIAAETEAFLDLQQDEGDDEKEEDERL